MDRIDILIIFLLILAISRGIRAGLLQLLFSTGGFFAGLFLGSWIALKVVHSSNASFRLLLILGFEAIFALSISFIGEVIGLQLSQNAKKIHLDKPNQIFGAIFEGASVLVIIWLVASAVSNVQAVRLGYYTQHSLIIRTLDKILPPPPDFFARLERIITPNGFPNVFVGLEPQHTTLPTPTSLNSQAVLADERSVVKVEGYGCGGLVQGSGFVVSNGIVVTNAHVIAGIPNPKVIDSSGTYSAAPIWFDPNMDLAVLRVSGISDSPLKLSSNNLSYGTPAAVLGFPEDSPVLVDQNATIIDVITAEGQNIYNQGIVYRQIYELESNVQPGNSGGPLIAGDGSVVGIVFAKSADQPDIGYALLTSDVQSSISEAIYQNTTVSDGQCTGS